MSERDEAGDKNEAVRERYTPLLAPLFFPDNPTKPDIMQYFCSLLRATGMEDKGSDPYTESRAVLDDLYRLIQMEFSQEDFAEPELARWRLGLLFYNHIVEMSAPYEVLTNLLRFRLGKGYHPNPFYDFLNKRQRKQFRRGGLFPKQKIDIIKHLSAEAGLEIGTIFDDFYNPDFRNAVAHSDFVFTEDGLRCRASSLFHAIKMTFEEVDDLITKAKAFIGTFWSLEREVRRIYGTYAGKSMAYDPKFKGVMEILVDGEGLMNGFKIHWPNASESIYRRHEAGVDMTNCYVAPESGTLALFVDRYARNPGTFSPLVEVENEPIYTPMENGEPTLWVS